MHIVLWDTRKLDVSKDFAGGFGVGQYPGYGGWRGWIIRRFFTRDHRPVAMLFAYLAAIFRRLGHTVEYAEDRMPDGADLYVFCPSLITLHLERDVIAKVRMRNPNARVFVAGLTATALPDAFADLGVTIISGEAEQLFWKFDEAYQQHHGIVDLGFTQDLDRLPYPDWSPFNPRKFRIGYDFWQFPTALIQSSRGCTQKCNYCPYILTNKSIRFRDPESVVDEINYCIRRWGFRSFKFRDPLFGSSRPRMCRMAELIGRLPRKIQFSIETRIELMPDELIGMLKEVGLTSITVGIESPDASQLRGYHRSGLSEDRQMEFIGTCRRLGIRTVAGFMIGFPGDTQQSIRKVEQYAKRLNPTFANFNVVTPYPGTEFFAANRELIAESDYTRYSSYSPVFKYKNLTHETLRNLHIRCFNHFYFRWDYLRDNAQLIWPSLLRFERKGNYLSNNGNKSGHTATYMLKSSRNRMKRGSVYLNTPHHYQSGEIH
jgi:anaerobic magnesium-protoporphyrin IX monomethyl ester cyclase